MAWLEDLSPNTTSSRLTDEGIDGRVLNVGWLDRTHPFSTGDVPKELGEALRALIPAAVSQRMRGSLPVCTLCSDSEESERARLQEGWSGCELRIVARDGTVFAVPDRIGHYVVAHHYRPPQAFVDAVLQREPVDAARAWEEDACPSCGSIMARHLESIGMDGDRRVFVVDFLCRRCKAFYMRDWPIDL